MHLYVKVKFLHSMRFEMGSQWRDLITGDMCSCFLVLVSILAAVFCICWRRWIWKSGSPYRRALPLSSLEERNAWRTFSAAAVVRNFLAWPIDLSWALHDFTNAETCWLRHIVSSKVAPRFLAVWEDLTKQSPILMLSMVTLWACLAGAMMISSVLSSLSYIR